MEKENIIIMLRHLCLLCVFIFGLMTMVATGGGDGNGTDSNTGTLYQYEYDNNGILVNTIVAGDCDCGFNNGICSREYNTLGQLIEECRIGDRPSPCADTKFSHDRFGRITSMEYYGSCDCEGYVPGEGTELCDIEYTTAGIMEWACYCSDEE